VTPSTYARPPALPSRPPGVAGAKLAEVFGFAIEYTDPNMNLRSSYPDFVTIEQDGTHAAVAVSDGRAEGR